ncbi:hypothetical protein SCHPADRAFT_908441 [Schizopora paradoxa]|uniref:SUZ domain-containing protein n=1 Tax=Schizopora paradoxa TaxID=27342 RepID=A0A0H2RGP6_9AGAM|nr:hypothetical protein SCHPADRAFT_908441 [Schizopora paradoxa]
MSFETPVSSSDSALGGSTPSVDQAMDVYAAQESSDHVDNNKSAATLSLDGQRGERASSSSSSHSSSLSSLPSNGTQQSDVDLARSMDGLALDGASTPDVDGTILEALKSKDRLFVLKLGEQMEALIKEKHSRTKYSLNTETTYQRLLVHRCAGYYKLVPESETGSKLMSVVIAMESKIPPRRICELVPPEEASHPAFKIMRRAQHDNKKQKSIISHPGSVAGEDGELSDVDPSESGSMGSRSTTSKTRKTIAERQADYEEARTRIFMNFKEKEKKERSASASSSSPSLVSPSEASSQVGAGDVAGGDVDDSASSAPTESEWSVSYTGERMRSVDSSTSATFPYRAGSSSFVGHEGSTTSSGRASPSSFNYPSLSESSNGPAPFGYDPNVQFQPPPPPPHANGFYAPYPGYPYPPPVSGPPFPPPPPHVPYPYYPQYSYGPPPPPPPPHGPVPHHQSASDPGSPVTRPMENFPRHSPPTNGPYGYVWQPQAPAPPHPGTPVNMSPQHPFPPSDLQSPSAMHSPPGPPHHNQGGQPMMYGPQPFPGYMPPMGYPPYPIPYYPPPPATSPMAHPHAQHPFPMESPISNGNGHERQSSSGGSSPTFSRSSSVMSGNSSNHGQHPPPAQRGAWSYGPGVGSNGLLWGPNNVAGDKVGPRLNMGMRKTSGASSASGSSGYRTPGDEASSTTSSSASSASSRRTFMTTPPSTTKHPLPARPDWATGLRPQPTLHAGRNRHHDGNGSSRNSPARPMMQLPPVPPFLQHQQQNQNLPPHSQSLPPPVLQPNDFPPLSSNPVDNKKPAAGGVWTNPGMARTILKAKPDNANSQPANSNYGNALFNHGQSPRPDDDERGFERPPPKGSAELFNPKGGNNAKRQGSMTQEKPEKEKKRSESLPDGFGLSGAAVVGSASARPAAPEMNGDKSSPRPDQAG